MELPAGFTNVGFQLCVGDLLLSMMCNVFAMILALLTLRLLNGGIYTCLY